jgi:hypothetical protein
MVTDLTVVLAVGALCNGVASHEAWRSPHILLTVPPLITQIG